MLLKTAIYTHLLLHGILLCRSLVIFYIFYILILIIDKYLYFFVHLISFYYNRFLTDVCAAVPQSPSPPRWMNKVPMCCSCRRGDHAVQSDHAGQHADGAVHEGHRHALRPPRPQRSHPQDHGEQAVLRGNGGGGCGCCKQTRARWFKVTPESIVVMDMFLLLTARCVSVSQTQALLLNTTADLQSMPACLM